MTMLTKIFLSHVCQVTFSNSSLHFGGWGIGALGFFSLSLGWALKGSPEGGGGRVCSIIEGGMYMGWGGIGTPLPHPSFISKFIIILPEMDSIWQILQWFYEGKHFFNNIYESRMANGQNKADIGLYDIHYLKSVKKKNKHNFCNLIILFAKKKKKKTLKWINMKKKFR